MEKYQIIYADPPWPFNNKKTGGSMVSGADAHYKTMSLKDICDLPVNEIADENCVLFMWWVASQPIEALKVVESWGFTLKTMSGFNWIKTTKNNKLHFGMGFWTRAGSELCLIAVKGKPKRASAGIRSVELADVEETIFAENEKHSKKPDIFRDRIVGLMGDVPRVELFAREQSEGWSVFGDEVENSISLEINKPNKIKKKFNINDCMYIQITEDGWNHLKKTVGDDYIDNCIKKPAYEKNINGEIWYRLQCWRCFDLMPPDFGGRALFNTNVMFDDESLKTL